MRFLPYLLAATLLGACSFTKNLEEHRAQLLAAAAPDVSLADKRDALGYSTVRMMNQAVNRLNPKKGVKYVKSYAAQNGPLLDTLAAQISRGTADMTTGQRVGFFLGAATRPYVKDAADLVPKFIKRYQQIQAVSRITGRLKEAVLGEAATKLGGFLGDIDGGVPSVRQDPLYPHREGEAEGDAR